MVYVWKKSDVVRPHLFYTQKDLHSIFALIKSYFWSILHILQKNQQSLQPDTHRKMNKPGVVALLMPERDLLFMSVLQALYFESYNVHSSQTV